MLGQVTFPLRKKILEQAMVCVDCYKLPPDLPIRADSNPKHLNTRCFESLNF